MDILYPAAIWSKTKREVSRRVANLSSDWRVFYQCVPHMVLGHVACHTVLYLPDYLSSIAAQLDLLNKLGCHQLLLCKVQRTKF